MELDKQGEPAIRFRLDPSSGVPTYAQLVRQVEHALRLGYLVPGDRLPTVKDVVSALAINPNTVLKAYRDLEHKGLVAGRPGVGTFVAAAPDVVPLRDVRHLRRGLDRWLRDATAAGLDDDDVRALVDAALHDRARNEAVS
ncbi:MAG: GntR family transcriptional regulator [Jatrophihabitans sp.]|nr:MAG: GntR family transcriptional regulator [Jatrophihabitans sp.]